MFWTISAVARIVLTAMLLVAPASVSCADTFQLRSGGTVRGRLLNPEQKPRSTYTIRVSTGGKVTLDADEVVKVTRPTAAQTEYERVLRKMPAETAGNHWLMAEWCNKQGLSRERKFHLEQTIKFDPDHEQARKALKYRRSKNGTWTRAEDEWKESGYVREGGRWQTPQAAEIAAKEEAREEAVIEWQKKLRMWRGWLGGKRHQQAVRGFASLTDPLAAEPLAQLFWNEPDPQLQEQLAELLGRMDSPIATAALVKGVMDGSGLEFRLHCLRQLEDNNRSVAGTFISQLGSKNNRDVRRAGKALQTFGDESSILPLIKAVRTQHKFKVKGGSPGNLNAGFNRDSSGRSGLGGLSMGGNKTRVITRSLENKEVRSALVKLTKQDFEYDTASWLRWYLARTTPPSLDLRRDE